MEISSENYQIANDAVRDILFMYRDLIESYAGFGHGIDTGTFDAVEFLKIDVREQPGSNLDLDIELIRTGAAISILCGLLDSWDEGVAPSDWMGTTGLIGRSYIELSNGRFAFDDLIENAVRSAFDDEQRFLATLRPVYEKHVIGYFKELVKRQESEAR